MKKNNDSRNLLLINLEIKKAQETNFLRDSLNILSHLNKSIRIKKGLLYGDTGIKKVQKKRTIKADKDIEKLFNETKKFNDWSIELISFEGKEPKDWIYDVDYYYNFSYHSKEEKAWQYKLVVESPYSDFESSKEFAIGFFKKISEKFPITWGCSFFTKKEKKPSLLIEGILNEYLNQEEEDFVTKIALESKKCQGRVIDLFWINVFPILKKAAKVKTLLEELDKNNCSLIETHKNIIIVNSCLLEFAIQNPTRSNVKEVLLKYYKNLFHTSL